MSRLFPMVGLLVVFGCPFPAFAQLDAPTALSDFAGCSHHTCTWTLLSEQTLFHEGDLTYGPDFEGNGDFVLRRANKELLRTGLKDLSASTSVVWSDDKRNFAVTWSNGGAIGTFSVRVFHIDGDSVSEWPAARQALCIFKARHWCSTRGDNIQAYRWLPDSRELVLVLSVYPTSDCGKDSGHTEAYVVDAASGNIKQHWGIRQLNAYMHSHPEW